MKHLKKFNEGSDNELNENLRISGRNSYSSPISSSSSSLKIKVIQSEYNYKPIENKKSIMFQTNENGVIIDDVSEIEKIIEFLMDERDKLM